jgi:hypothetical protein
MKDPVGDRSGYQLSKARGTVGPHHDEVNVIEGQELFDNIQCCAGKQATLAFNLSTLSGLRQQFPFGLILKLSALYEDLRPGLTALAHLSPWRAPEGSWNRNAGQWRERDREPIRMRLRSRLLRRYS